MSMHRSRHQFSVQQRVTLGCRLHESVLNDEGQLLPLFEFEFELDFDFDFDFDFDMGFEFEFEFDFELGFEFVCEFKFGVRVRF